MKYVCFAENGFRFWGLLNGSEITVLSCSYFEEFSPTLLKRDIKDVQLLAPCLPTKAMCVGFNYTDHASEFGIKVPARPNIFIKPSSCLLDPEGAILHTDVSTRVDYEAELAIVIKKEAYKVSEEDFSSYVLGFTCANDVTARDLQVPGEQWAIAKCFDTFMPIGPIITDEVDPNNLHITTRVNGVVKQDSNTSFLHFKPAYLLSYITRSMTLYPGDVILTGTPSGISPMNPGDVVEVEIEGIGVLRNRVL